MAKKMEQISKQKQSIRNEIEAYEKQIMELDQKQKQLQKSAATSEEKHQDKKQLAIANDHMRSNINIKLQMRQQEYHELDLKHKQINDQKKELVQTQSVYETIIVEKKE